MCSRPLIGVVYVVLYYKVFLLNNNIYKSYIVSLLRLHLSILSLNAGLNRSLRVLFV